MPRDPSLYLIDIREAIERIREYLAGMSLQEFRKDRKTLDAVVRNLEIIGEASKSLSPQTKELTPDVEWRKVAGLRDILSHEYFGVDVDIVWDVVQNKLPRPAASGCEAAGEHKLTADPYFSVIFHTPVHGPACGFSASARHFAT